MTAESSDSGLDELKRLSQQLKEQQREATEREKLSARQKETSQGVLSELRAFSISMAVRQLRPIASPEIIKQVDALQSRQGTAELRKLINNLMYDLEKQITITAGVNPDIKPIEQSIWSYPREFLPTWRFPG